MNNLDKGIYKFTFGTPDEHGFFALIKHERSPYLKDKESLDCPFSEEDFHFRVTPRGVLIEMCPNENEKFYGLGLQLKSFCQNGSKKHLRVNANPAGDTGDSHAPAPFLISTANYGIIVDSLRHVTFGVVNNTKKRPRKGLSVGGKTVAATDTDSLYKSSGSSESVLNIEVPSAKGVDIYVIAGKDVRDVVERYNLLFGGGCMPSLASLGVLYRAYGRADEKHVLSLAESIRADKIPCDNFGLEPGWQTRSYSCSYLINRKNFPDFEKTVEKLRDNRFHVNVWEHAFINAESPLYEELYDYSGDYEVWRGLVPDFLYKDCTEKFGSYHQKYIDMGIESVKLDECDNSDYTLGWSFPDYAEFPSGLDGEEMHAVFGHLYANVFDKLFRKNDMRHLSQCRSNYLGASSQAFVVASDLYKHKDFLNGMITASFSGLIWSPEVRQTESEEELIRRLELVALSPYCCINMWMVPFAPWKQWDETKNKNGEILSNAERLTARCRKILQLRMILLPYLYTAYYHYYKNGTPPIKAVVLNYQDDENTYNLDDEYLIGDDILVAPFIADEIKDCRKVYLPAGNWYDFYTNEKIGGGRYIEVKREGKDIPVYVREGAVLPLAEPREFVPDPNRKEKFRITLRVYGENAESCVLYEDDAKTYAFERGECNLLQISLNGDKIIIDKKGDYRGESLYEICGVERV